MSEWFSLQGSLYFLHAQVKLWLKAEEMKLVEAVKKAQDEQIRRTCDLTLLVCRSCSEQALKKRALVTVQRLLALTLVLLKKRRDATNNFATGELQQYLDELQQLLTEVEEKIANGQEEKEQVGVSELERRELFSQADTDNSKTSH